MSIALITADSREVAVRWTEARATLWEGDPEVQEQPEQTVAVSI